MTHSSDRQAWLEARRALVTASDVARMLGHAYEKKPASSPEEQRAQAAKQRGKLMSEKAGLAEEWGGNETTQLATVYERATAQEAVAVMWGWTTRMRGDLIVDPECDKLGATLDAEVMTPWAGWCPFDVKVSSGAAQECVRPVRKDGSPSTAMFLHGIPIYYQLQLQVQMACTGARHAALVVLHHADPDLKLRAYYMPRHDAVIQHVRAEAVRFFQDLERLKRGEMT